LSIIHKVTNFICHLLLQDSKTWSMKHMCHSKSATNEIVSTCN